MDLQHPWLIWVCIYLKILIQGKLHLKNSLLMLTPKNYMNQSMYLLLQNGLCVILDAKYEKSDLHKVMET